MTNTKNNALLIRPKNLLVTIAGLLLFYCATSFAAGLSPIAVGPKPGSKIPELTVKDQFGDRQILTNILREKGAVIVLFRSADWCPYCQKHLLELNVIADQFKTASFGLAAISYDSPDILRKFAQKESIQYSLLSDQKVATFKALNVVNPLHPPGNKHHGIPYPGVIVVDAKGVVIQSYFYQGYKNRVSFSQLLTKLSQ